MIATATTAAAATRYNSSTGTLSSNGAVLVFSFASVGKVVLVDDVGPMKLVASIKVSWGLWLKSNEFIIS